MKYFLYIFALTASFCLAETQPNYTVTEIPNPPSKFETKQIDGLDFLPDGRMAVCLPSGEIFFYNLETKEWQLFAEGLHNPLGLIALSNSELVISQRPELTRVRDTDGDGLADDYEVISDDFGMSGNYHEFHFTPVRDKDGNYYVGLGTGSSGNGIRTIVRGKFDPRGRPGRMHASTPYRGCILKITPEGKTSVYSYGHRTPNGLGFDLKGNLFVTDNQGDWVGSSKLFHVQKDHFYGHATSLTWKPDFEGVPVETPAETLAKLRTRACVVFPHGTMANSPTQVLAISPKAKIGPFEGQLLVGEMNRPRIMRVMLEAVDGQLQGACVPFIDGKPLRNGCNRFAWAPDGSLLVGLTKHTWAGNEGIQRVTWDGQTPFEVETMKLTEKGFEFNFTKPVNAEQALNKANWPFSRYYYRYHVAYGSPRMDEVPVAVDDITISKDRKKVTIDLAELEAWHIHEVTIKALSADDGSKLTNNYLAYTLNRLHSNTPPEPLQAESANKKSNKGSSKQSSGKPVPVIDPQGTVYQAETAERKGAALSKSNSGWTGTGYIDFGSGKQSLTWKVESEKDVEVELLFNYALGSGSRPLELKVNGKTTATLPFKSTNSWTTWADQKSSAKLTKGSNTISLQTLDKSGPNIDHIQVVQKQ